MRKALIAVIVASALFAVGAFAASFQVSSEDVASGSNDVVACADLVDVDFTTTYFAADNGWRATAAVVKFYDGTAASPLATNDCALYDATLVLEDSDGVVITPAAPTTAVPTGADSVTITWPVAADAPLVGAIGRASVLVGGQALFVDPTL